MGHAHADISKHIKAYITVFVVLAVATIITVAVSRVDFGGHLNVVVALAIAAVKASLVAAIFMHLKWEKSIGIWWTLAICGVFFAALMALPVLTSHDLPALSHHATWDVLPRAEAASSGHGGGH